jgi:2-dehydropantoate 2-reductase
MKITVVGAGAMGCRFGAALFEVGHQVTLLDGWREHVTAVNQGGLRVTDATGTRVLPVPAVLFDSPPRHPFLNPPRHSSLNPPRHPFLNPPRHPFLNPPRHPLPTLPGRPSSDPGPADQVPAPGDAADLVIVFAKATATGTVAAAAAATGAIGRSTLVLTLQNGLGNVEALLAHVPADRLLAGTTTLGTELLGPGHIRALGSGETVLGPLPAGFRPLGALAGEPPPGTAPPGTASPGTMSPGTIAADAARPGAVGGVATEPAERIALTLYGAGISVRTSANALEVIWAKVAFNCVMNALCSIASIPVSALARYDGFDALASSVLDEIAAVARAEGVIVDTAAALRLMRAQFDRSASGDHLASMLQDLMNGRPTEIAQLNGAIADRAAAHGIDAPVNAAITRLVRLLEATWTSRVNRLHPGLP